MKIIGKIEKGNYIAEISSDEILKVLENAYEYKGGKYQDLPVGTEIDLSIGYKFLYDIKDLCRTFTESNNSFERSKNTVIKFTELLLDKYKEGD